MRENPWTDILAAMLNDLDFKKRVIDYCQSQPLQDQNILVWSFLGFRADEIAKENDMTPRRVNQVKNKHIAKICQFLRFSA